MTHDNDGKTPNDSSYLANLYLLQRFPALFPGSKPRGPEMNLHFQGVILGLGY